MYGNTLIHLWNVNLIVQVLVHFLNEYPLTNNTLLKIRYDT
jgi:hypothetical protein